MLLDFFWVADFQFQPCDFSRQNPHVEFPLVFFTALAFSQPNFQPEISNMPPAKTTPTPLSNKAGGTADQFLAAPATLERAHELNLANLISQVIFITAAFLRCGSL